MTATVEIPTESAVVLLPLEQLLANPDNPRADVGDVTELAQSIRENGGRLLQPIVVVPAPLYRAESGQMPDETDDGRYVVIAGHRRRAALLELDALEADCIVRTDLVGPAAQIAMLVENLQRVDLAALEEAEAFNRLKGLGLKQRDIADRVGRSQAHISKRLALLNLPEVARQAVVDGSVTLGDAAAVAALVDDPDSFRQAWQLVQSPYLDGKTAVERVQADKARREKVAAERARLSTAGLTVVDARPQAWYYAGDKTPKTLALDAFHTKPRRHNKLACHAVYVDDYARTVEVCTDPGQHLKPTKAEDAAKARAKAEAQALKDAAAGRRTAALQVVKGGVSARRLRALLEHAVLAGGSSYQSNRLAEQLLNDLAAASGGPVEPESWPRTVRALAAAVGIIEAELEYRAWPSFSWWFELLVDEAGYELTELEQKRLAEDQPT